MNLKIDRFAHMLEMATPVLETHSVGTLYELLLGLKKIPVHFININKFETQNYI